MSEPKTGNHFPSNNNIGGIPSRLGLWTRPSLLPSLTLVSPSPPYSVFCSLLFFYWFLFFFSFIVFILIFSTKNRFIFHGKQQLFGNYTLPPLLWKLQSIPYIFINYKLAPTFHILQIGAPNVSKFEN